MSVEHVTFKTCIGFQSCFRVCFLRLSPMRQISLGSLDYIFQVMGNKGGAV